MITLPEIYSKKINSLLDLSNIDKITESILRQSDFYIENPTDQTPWQEKWVQAAQLAYYFPLNYARISSLIERAKQVNFFDGLDNFVDFGTGLGPLCVQLQPLIPKGVLVESNELAQNLFNKMHPPIFSFANKIYVYKNTLAAFSFVLTEIQTLPRWAYDCEAILIIEPATHQDGRQVMKLRQDLIDKGFYIWAPCTHQKKCPLLTYSKKDWCHDRTHWQMPEWFKKIEEKLPIKNNTLTYSYLLARKTKPSEIKSTRVVGDMLEEKGKTKVMICRGEDREFLSWLHRDKIKQNISRGDLIEIPENSEKKGNEVRVKV